MPHPTPKNVVLIGTGMVAKAHLLSVADLSSKVTLRGVLSGKPENAEKFAGEASDLLAHSITAYRNIDEVCSDEEIDAAILITPPNARLEIVSKLAKAGIHILSEKPLERTVPAAKQIVEACENANVSLGTVFQHRMRKASQHLRQLIKEEKLGRLAIVEAIVPWWREQAYYDEQGRGTYERDGGGVLISQAIHTMDLMSSLAGPVQEVQAMAHTTMLHELEAEDYVTAGMTFMNGAAGTLIASTGNYPGDAESITLHFTKCVARLQSGELTLSWRDERVETFGETANTGGGADPMAFTHEWHRDILEDFIDALNDKRPPLVTGREALKVHKLIEAIMTSSDTGKRTRLAE